MGGWFNKRGKKGTVKLDTTIEYIVHEQRWRVELLPRSKRCITNTYNGTTGAGGTNRGARRPPNTVCTRMCLAEITVIRYLFGASNLQNSRTMTTSIPKPTNEMVHADGWTPERCFPFSLPAICDLLCECKMRSATDQGRTKVILKETRSKVN